MRNMSKLIATVGLPGSGKTWWAIKSGLPVVCKDDIRLEFEKGGWKWSPQNESAVIARRDYLITSDLKNGMSCVSADTNFGRHLDNLWKLAESCGADFELKDFRDVPPWVCAERNAKRGFVVPERVIWDMAEANLTPSQLVPGRKSPQLFVDLDGVLADFDGFISKEFGIENNRDNELPNFWDIVGGYKGKLYADVAPLPYATRLWETLKPYSPVILSGVPFGHFPESAQDKRDWVRRYIDPEARVITCKSRNKSNYLVKEDILVDDWPKYQSLWEGKGGIFVHHTDPDDTIKQVKGLLG